MFTRTVIDPFDPKLLDIEPKFWFRDEHGKAYPAELEYLLPENIIIVEEICSGKRNQNLRVESQTYMQLPYYPGDIYFNDKAVISEYEYYHKGMLVPTTSAELNGATLMTIGAGVEAPRVNSIHSKFVYEDKSYLIKSINDGSGYAVTADGRQGYGASSRLVRLYKPETDPPEMLMLADLNPKNTDNLRLLSCLATLLTAKDVYEIGRNLKEGKPDPSRVGKMDVIRIDLVGAERWTAGPF